MNRVLGVVKKISSQRLPTRFILSASDKATIEDCNRQMTQAFGLYGVRKTLTFFQSAQARIFIIQIRPKLLSPRKMPSLGLSPS